MREKIYFAALLIVNIAVLTAQINGLSISAHEAAIIYGPFSPLQGFITFFLESFGYNDYALRLPMIGLHALSVVLLFALSKHYVRGEYDRIWIVLIYMLLPGVTSAALVVDAAGIIIALLFLFVYLFLRYGFYALVILPFLLWADPSFLYLYFAIVVYGLFEKNYTISAAGVVFLISSLYLYGIDIGGAPRGHFLDTIGVYAAIFSPIVFIYLFYVLYRRFISHDYDLLWAVAASAFMVSILLSFRQRVDIQNFAPYLMVAIPLAAQTFFHTYRIRLRPFRWRYRVLFYTAFGILIANSLAVFFNTFFYRFVNEPKRHFAYPMHVAKEFASELKKNGIRCSDAEDASFQLRLRFYGIDKCGERSLSERPVANAKKVTISYINIPIFSRYVTNSSN